MLDHRNAGNERIFVHHSQIDSISITQTCLKQPHILTMHTKPQRIIFVMQK